DRGLEGGGDVGDERLVEWTCVRRQRGEDGGLEAREREFESSLIEHRPREVEGITTPAFGGAIDRGATRESQPEMFRHLVDRRAGGVAERAAEPAVTPESVHEHELRVAARDDEGDRGIRTRAVFEVGRVEVCLDVVDADDRNAEPERVRLAERQ